MKFNIKEVINMEFDRKLVVEQEQIDIDDEMAENDDEEPDDNIWLGSLAALLSPCRPIYHSTRQPLYPELSAEVVKAEVISRLAQTITAQNQVALQRAMGINMTPPHVNDNPVHFENADVTITKIKKNSPTPADYNYKVEPNYANFQPVSVASISNGNTKVVNNLRFVCFILYC